MCCSHMIKYNTVVYTFPSQFAIKPPFYVSIYLIPPVHTSNITNVSFLGEYLFISQQESDLASIPVFTKSETKPFLFWVNNTIREWTAQLNGLLWHIIDFTLCADWVLAPMRKYAVRTFGLWGGWLIRSTESHLRGEQILARETTEEIEYQGNIYTVI